MRSTDSSSTGSSIADIYNRCRHFFRARSRLGLQSFNAFRQPVPPLMPPPPPRDDDCRASTISKDSISTPIPFVVPTVKDLTGKWLPRRPVSYKTFIADKPYVLTEIDTNLGGWAPQLEAFIAGMDMEEIKWDASVRGTPVVRRKSYFIEIEPVRGSRHRLAA